MLLRLCLFDVDRIASPKRNPADELQLMKRTVDMPTQAEILIESPNEYVIYFIYIPL
jgi:hypothetical protein